MSWKLLVASVLVHLVLIYSIFDVYYTSPLVHGIPAHFLNNIEPPAKRIVIISADGLRYDTFNNHPEMSPYLHSIIRNRKGISGLSLSHVPTESRPGHVAIFAGITEDMSAVAKGWKKNPVKFDSVFNRSANCWMWGSPDIVNLFDDLPNTNSFSYSEDEEDFAAKDASNLDKWVFTNFENFLNKEAENEKLKESQNIFFLHLLGIDTNGHGNKPQSKQYIENVRVVDEGIEKVQKIVDEYFKDDKTAWLFTSDHGMTDWGSHGAGSDEEVLTPFVAWGAGIRKGGARMSINQIDLAPLISALIGSAIPVNSMGVIPIQILNSGNPKYEFRATLANFLQLKEQVTFLRNSKSHRFWFKEFPEFGNKAITALEGEMVKLARARRFEAATSLFADKSHLLKNAIVFYHRYDRQMLGYAVSATFVAWIALVAVFLNKSPPLKTIDLFLPNKFFSICIVLSILFAFYCPLTFTKTIYIVLPVFLVSIFENYSKMSTEILSFLNRVNSKKDLNSLNIDKFVMPFLGLIGFSFIIFVFVLSFMDRRFLSLIFGILVFLPASYNSPVVSYWTKTWRILCISLLPFPFLPAVGVSTHIPVCIAAPLALSFACWKLSKRGCLARISGMLKVLAYCQLGTGVMILVVNYGFDKPPAIARWISWLSIPLSIIVPSFLSSSYLVDRLIAYSLSFYIPYSLLSISYESLFVLLFLPLLAVFIRFEFGHLSDVELMQITTIPSSSQASIFTEIRRSVVCVSFVLCTLFGTGNFASINSFNPSTLNLFISIFSPFTMAILLILKLLLPILCVSLSFSAILRFDAKSMQRICCYVLILTDFMSMCFFHQLRDEGSWLDIGMSISQYIVSMCISLALLILLSISSSLMSLDFKRQKSQYFTEVESSPFKTRSDDESA